MKRSLPDVVRSLREALERSERPPAIVLGLGQNGLATVRALGRRGIPVIGVESDMTRPTARSRYCFALHCPEFSKGGEALVAFLCELGRALPRRGVLFPSGDLNLRAVSDHRDALARYFRFALPDREAVELALDKRAFYEFAAREGYPIPTTFVLDAGGAAAVAGKLRYPAIIKPYLRDVEWRDSHQAKCYEVATADELIRECEHLAARHPRLLVQESIPGPDSELFFSLTYLDARLEPLGMFTGRKLRQYRPRFGTSSLAVSVWEPRVAETTLALLRALRYRGYASVEFKRDARDGEFKIIELTGRTWYPHGLATACGVNLPYLAYCNVLGLPTESPRRFDEGVKWIDEDRDLRSGLAYHRAGQLGIRSWIASYRGRRTYAIGAADDPAPFVFFCLRWARAVGRRLFPLGRWRRHRATTSKAAAHGAAS